MHMYIGMCSCVCMLYINGCTSTHTNVCMSHMHVHATHMHTSVFMYYTVSMCTLCMHMLHCVCTPAYVCLQTHVHTYTHVHTILGLALSPA